MLKCEFAGDGQHHQSGYILINGGWKNTVRAIARQDDINNLYGKDAFEASRVDSFLDSGLVFSREHQE